MINRILLLIALLLALTLPALAAGESFDVSKTVPLLPSWQRDQLAVVAFAQPLIEGGRFRLINDRFSTLLEHLGPASVDGVVFDPSKAAEYAKGFKIKA